MGMGPFDTEREERQWWDQLPSVPAVTSVLLRQQNRRRWKPASLVTYVRPFPQTPGSPLRALEGMGLPRAPDRYR